MKSIIITFGFFLIDVYAFLEVQTNYHDAIGIPTAKKIKALEEASQANGTINIENRIIGGELTPYPVPFFAGLLIQVVGTPELSACGSSLLSYNRVVTAAHCNFDGIKLALEFYVRFGSRLLYSGGQSITTRKVIVHPHYDLNFFTNDIAVLYLPQNVIFTDTVRPIRLPNLNNFELTNQFVGHLAIAVGFGRTSDKQHNSAIELSHVQLQVIDNAQCQSFYKINFVTSSSICTSGETITGKVGTCYGDSGGPLFILDNNREPVLIGITSFGSKENGCAVYPSVFTRVTSFADFITNHVKFN